MKTFQLIALSLTTFVCNAQVVEHFSDGDFTSNPVWSGSTSHFVVNANQQLQLNNTVAATSYLTTPFPSTSLDGFEWEVFAKQSFAPSGSNFGRVYLVSSSDNLTEPLNGYYLQLGEAGTADAVELFRQSGTSHISVCRGPGGMVAASFAIRIKVIRNADGLWKLLIDDTGGGSFVEVAQGVDATFSTSSFAGILCTYTSGNATKFYFDDLLAGPPLGDITPPQLEVAEVESDSTLLLRFSETLDTTAGVFVGSDGLGIPASVVPTEEGISFKLAFSSPFLNGKLYHLLMDSISDAAGNLMPPLTISFRHFVPLAAAPGDVVFNELFPDPSPSVGLPTYEFLELYNRSGKAFHLQGWTVADATSTATLPSHYLLPGEYVIVTSTAGVPIYSGFGATIGLTDMPTLNNASDNFMMRDASGTLIDSVFYASSWYGDDDRAQGGYTLERLQPGAATNDPLNWIASEALLGGTPAVANSVLGRKLDSKAPFIDSLVVAGENQLHIYFNEAMDYSSLVEGIYQLQSMASPIDVIAFERSALLTFETPFYNGHESMLLIDAVRDTAQNIMPAVYRSFRYFVAGLPAPGVILINEIMADPSPVVHLPEAEYVEIVNHGTEPFDLREWSLCDATSCALLPGRIMLPGQFLVLTSTTNASKFESAKVVGVVGFPSLNNAGEPLALRSPDGQRIDSLRYDIAWFGNDSKRDGGWSLERLLTDYQSTSELNWRPARDSSGGTPGRPNSILGDKLDATPPSIDSLVVLSPHELRIYFNEPMDSASLSDRLLFYVEKPGELSSTATALERSVTLSFVTLFLNGHENRLWVDSLADVAGNKMATVQLAFRYFVPGIPTFAQVVINEIMADPSPVVYLPEAEFVEIFNHSDDPFDLHGWTLSDGTASANLPAAILLPGEFAVLTTTSSASRFDSAVKVVGVSNFPSLSNSGEPLVLRDGHGAVIDSIRYDAAWLGEGEKRDGGWSLERLLYDYASVSPMNWRAAIDSSGGTPGRPNSVVGQKLDPIPPKLDSLMVLNANSLRLYFNESMDSVSLSRLESFFNVTSEEHPTAAAVSDSSVKVAFAQPFNNGVQQFLTIEGVTDLSDNQLSPIQIPFMYFDPGTASRGVVVINEIMADPSPVVHLPEAEFIEIFNNSADPFDLRGWTLSDGTGSANIPATILLPGEFAILTTTSSASRFDSAVKVVGVSNFPSLSNSGESLVLSDREGTVIDSIRYDAAWLGEGEKRDGGWSLERLLYDYSSVSPMNWRAAIDSSGGTPGRPNSVVGQKLDPIPPRLDSLTVLNSNSLRLYFNEPMDSTSLAQLESYHNQEGRIPTAISTSGSSVTMTFTQGFTNGVQNVLRVEGLMDKSGNELSPTQIPFMYFDPGTASRGVVVINEIMADPSPVVHLPEAEFIEIFNNSADPFDLRGWTLSDGTGSANIPATILLPGEFAILTTTSSASRFDSAVKVVGVSNFPSLSNSGESLVLSDREGTVIDSIRYDAAWLGEGEKRDGGWSLERLLYDYSSVSQMNWRAAIDSSGGTPGRPNSVVGQKLDPIPPRLDSLTVLNSNSLRLYFNEPMDSTSLAQLESYHNQEGRIPTAISTSGSSVTMTFTQGFTNGVQNVLRVEGLMDKSGNELSPTQIPFMYFVPGTSSHGVIVINEIMADPSPVVRLPEAEFIEIFNNSDDPFDLHGWTLSDGTASANLPAAILLPGEFAVLTTTSSASRFDSAVKVVGVTNFPSLSNSGESLVLSDREGTVIDSIRYDAAWLGEGEKRDGGWSLERLLYDYSSVSQMNWRAAIDSSGGTPGRPNSILGQKLDPVAPRLDSLTVLNANSLRLFFNESMDSVSLSRLESYFNLPSEEHPTVAAVSDSSVTVAFVQDFTNGVQQFLTIEGVTDLSYNQLSPTQVPFMHFVPGTASHGVVVINEIMADPSPVVHLPEAEFFEIFNRSEDPFDLHGWTLSDGTTSATLPVSSLLPGEFAILTTSSSASRFDSVINVIGVSGFPSLSNSGEALVLRNREGTVIDSVRYEIGWVGESEKRDGGWSLERLLYDYSSTSPMNWRAAIDSSGGTPGRPNSILGQKLDPVAPRLDSLTVLNSNSLRLYFNESMDSVSLSLLDSYFSVSFGEHPISTSVFDSSVTVAFAQNFNNGVQHFLSVESVSDRSSNQLSPIQIPFMYFVPGTSSHGVIVINEIMADPSPVVRLPEAEFIEIFNNSDDPFDLDGWTLSDGTSSAKLPAAMFLPGEFAVLTTSSSASRFDSAINVVGVSNFPSLSNSGEPLVLRDRQGAVIDSVRYDAAWVGEGEKRDGGWSMERLLYDYSSVSPMNWRAAIDSSGGTPGRPNSVVGQKLDPIQPKLDSLMVLNANSLRLYFNEAMDSTSLARVESYLNVSIGEHPNWTSVSDSSVILLFARAFTNGVQQFLEIEGVSDRSGNELSPIQLPFMYFVPGATEAGVIVINEIMADPSPVVNLPEAEFIEIYNHSADPFDLHGWTLTDGTASVDLPVAILLPGEFAILTTSSSASRFDSAINVVSVSGFPSLSNSSEALVLRDDHGTVIDSVRYEIGWLGEGEKRDGGWSMERLLYDYSSVSPMNWRAAIDSTGGTPGRPNSIVGQKLDPIPPRLDSLTVLNANSIRLYFNESMDSTSLAQFESYHDLAGQIPTVVMISDSSVAVTFAQAFTNGVQNVLMVEHLTDKAGNEFVPIHIPFMYFVRGATKAGVLVINEIMADPSPIVHLPEAEFVEIFNRSEDPFDLHGWTLSDGTASVDLPVAILLPGEFAILTTSSSASRFDSPIKVVGVSNFPSLSNSGEPLVLRDRQGAVIDSVRYDAAWVGEGEKRDGGWSMERLLYDYSSVSPMNWRAAIDSSGGTPGRPNSIIGQKLDPVPARLDSLTVLNANGLRLYFNESMDSVSLSRLDSYFSVSFGEHPISASVSDSSVTLAFAQDFTNGVQHFLSVESVGDRSGNQLSPIQMPFMYFIPGETKAGVVVINEIMADPSPVVHLPEAEFVEIFNNNADPFDLHGWTLSDGSGSTALPAAILLPGEFAILTTSSSASRFDSAVNVVGVSGFPSLSNSGEALVLRDDHGTVIDSVRYDAAWLGEGEKRDGGWSLERLLYDYSSVSPMNWRAAIDSSGGTPGRPNSIVGQKLDPIPPRLDSLTVLNANSIRLYFNESMDSTSLSRPESYFNLSSDEHPTTAAASDSSVTLTFARAFPNGVQQLLRIESLTDLSDNENSLLLIPFMYFMPGETKAGVVVINEIMADPSPVVHLPEAEFVEIFNRSEDPFDLHGWTLSDGTASSTLPVSILLPGEFAILTTLSSASRFDSAINVVGVSGFPSLSNSGEPLVLRDSHGTVIDSVRYDAAWLGEGEKRDGGWSLERLLYDYSSVSPMNWRAAIDSSGGTPGRPNSIVGQKLDPIPPRLDSLTVLNANSIRLYLNESMDSTSLSRPESYFNLSSEEHPTTAAASDSSVTLTFARAFPNGVQQLLRIESLTDLSDNENSLLLIPFMYFMPGETKAGVVVINEIMADPSPVVHLPEAEFVEIFNRSEDPFDLHGWTLSDGTASSTLPVSILLPGEFAILTTLSSASRFDSAINVVGVSGFPSLSNSGEALVLRDDHGTVIDSVRYEAAWLGEDEKRDGGWSMERLLYDYSSMSPMNWRAAIDSSGGTLGRPNSIVGQKLDPVLPKLDSLTVLNANSLRLFFNESMDSVSLSRLESYFNLPSEEHPTVAAVSDSSVTVAFVQDFTNGVQQFLTIEGVTDLSNNQLSPIQIPFMYFVPGATEAGVIVINEIMADPSPVVNLFEAEFIEIFNNSADPFDVHGWTLSDGTASSTLPVSILLPGEFAILTTSSSASRFDSTINAVGVSGFPSLSNSGEALVLRDDHGTVIDSVRYDAAWLGEGEKRDGGWSLERLLYDFASTAPMNWRAAIDSSGGTPGRPNSVVGQKHDPIPPRLDSLTVLNANSLRLYFNEPMDSTSLARVESYLNVSIGEHPNWTSVSDSSVILTFARAFTNGVQQFLEIEGVSDRSGNELSPMQIPFMYFVPGVTKAGVVVINEIMADPSPVVHLPEAEFIEIYNHSADPFDLHGWTLSDGTGSANFPATILLPGEFAVLTTPSSTSRFDSAINVVGVSNFPSLSNSGEPLVLRNREGTVIDSVRYEAAWLGDGDKLDGGWTLERVLPQYLSTSAMNWRSSVDSAGGTPGRMNSVFGERLDTTPPEVDSVVVVNNHELHVYFNEPMDSLSLARNNFYFVNGTNESPFAITTFDQTAALMFTRAFVNGNKYQFSIHSVADSSGNVMLPAEINFMHFVPGNAGRGVVQFNEIMADPTPTVQLPEAEFLELINNSEEPYDLRGWLLADETTEVTLPSFIIQPGDIVTVTATTNAEKFAGKVLDIPSFPSLSNSGESLVLRSPTRITIDSMRYEIDWYGADSKREGGWSLERLSPDFSSLAEGNWRPATDPTGGTPGRENSIVGQQLDVVAPLVDSIVLVDDHRLSVFFSETMDPASLNSGAYIIEETGQRPNYIISAVRSVTLAFEFAFDNGKELHLYVSAVADSSGNSISPVRLSFRYPVTGSVSAGVVLINEIMSDPTPVVGLPEAEYVEIVNRSSRPVDLQGWKLLDTSTEAVLPAAIILPGEFLIVTSGTNQLKFGRKVLGVAGFPSLNNAGEALVLRCNDGTVIDSVRYSIDWFGEDPKRDGGWSLERLRYELGSSWELNWRASLDPGGGTPGFANSRHGQHPDQQPPGLLTASVEDANHILISFDEEIADPASLSQIKVDTTSCAGFDRIDATRIRAAFESPFLNGRTFTLRLSAMVDTAENRMPDTERLLRYFIPRPVAARDVIITEIMADPTPTVGLPEAEYIEVMNRSANAINLVGWRLVDGQGPVILPDAILQPGEQVVLLSSNSEVLFPSTSRSVSVRGFPSLANEGESLMLRDALGSPVDSLSFNEDWYRSTSKSDGGWALELIDPANPCGGAENWASSESPDGGTPGSVNSIYANKPDMTGPRLMGAELQSNTSLLLTFNEQLERSFANAAIELKPSAGNYAMQFTDLSLKVVDVTFQEALHGSTEYSMMVEGIFDCNGNLIDRHHAELRFAVPEDPHPGDIVINEILFDPRPNGVDFVEVYNQSPRYINLNHWQFAHADETSSGNVDISDAGIVPPLSYKVFTSDPSVLGSHYPQMNNAAVVVTALPSMPDDEGGIVLMDKDGHTVDSVQYDASMQSPMLADSEGVSLERISFSAGSNDPSNWRSANESAGFATPGFVNSNTRLMLAEDEGEITVSPEVISVQGVGEFTLISYNLSAPGNFASCRIVDQQGRVIREVAQNVSVGSQGFFRWDADDETGQRVMPGYYVVCFEYFNAEGQVHISRNRVIVAPR